MQVPHIVSELQEIVIVQAKKFLKGSYVTNVRTGEVMTEAQQESLLRALNDPEARLPAESVDYGAGFRIRLGQISINSAALAETQSRQEIVDDTQY